MKTKYILFPLIFIFLLIQCKKNEPIKSHDNSKEAIYITEVNTFSTTVAVNLTDFTLPVANQEFQLDLVIEYGNIFNNDSLVYDTLVIPINKYTNEIKEFSETFTIPTPGDTSFCQAKLQVTANNVSFRVSKTISWRSLGGLEKNDLVWGFTTYVGNYHERFASSNFNVFFPNQYNIQYYGIVNHSPLNASQPAGGEVLVNMDETKNYIVLHGVYTGTGSNGRKFFIMNKNSITWSIKTAAPSFFDDFFTTGNYGPYHQLLSIGDKLYFDATFGNTSTVNRRLISYDIPTDVFQVEKSYHTTDDLVWNKIPIEDYFDVECYGKAYTYFDNSNNGVSNPGLYYFNTTTFDWENANLSIPLTGKAALFRINEELYLSTTDRKCYKIDANHNAHYLGQTSDFFTTDEPPADGFQNWGILSGEDGNAYVFRKKFIAGPVEGHYMNKINIK